MIVIRALALLLTLAVAGTLHMASGRVAGSRATTGVRL
jgi:hypothetical protein